MGDVLSVLTCPPQKVAPVQSLTVSSLHQLCACLRITERVGGPLGKAPKTSIC